MQALGRRRRFHVYGNQNADPAGWSLGSYVVRERDFPRSDTVGTVDNIEMDVHGSRRGTSAVDDTVQHSPSQYASGSRSWLVGRWGGGDCKTFLYIIERCLR